MKSKEKLTHYSRVKQRLWYKYFGAGLINRKVLLHLTSVTLFCLQRYHLSIMSRTPKYFYIILCNLASFWSHTLHSEFARKLGYIILKQKTTLRTCNSYGNSPCMPIILCKFIVIPENVNTGKQRRSICDFHPFSEKLFANSIYKKLNF